MNALLIVNPRSGRGETPTEELVAAAKALGIDTRLLEPGDDPGEIARGSSADVLGMAGGDGSLAPVADVALEREAAFVCIPFGTRNHFARDVGLHRDDPLGALSAFTGSERRIDVGRAGNRLFLNNVSLGAYARLVHRRECNRRRREALARLRAWATLLTHREPLGITIDGEPVEGRLVLVANNAYALDLPSLGGRERLDGGSSTYTAQETNGWATASSSTRPPDGSRPRSTASRMRCERRSSSESRRARYECSYPTAAASTAG